jgi:hypothetical protein
MDMSATLPEPRDTVADPRAASRNRALMRLQVLAVHNAVRPGPAGSISTPTALGLTTGQLFVGGAFQHRTRYTHDADAGAAIGVGIGSARLVALEATLTTYSTIRDGGPGETGGVSFKLHHLLPRESAIAAGVESLGLWGGSDTERSMYAVGSHLFRFDLALVSLGVGNGRFRSEDQVADDRGTVSVFGSAGLRVATPLSLIADWTGQDLALAASFTPIRRQALIISPGVTDVLGTAGDGVRFILSVGYGVSLRRPF